MSLPPGLVVGDLYREQLGNDNRITAPGDRALAITRYVPINDGQKQIIHTRGNHQLGTIRFHCNQNDSAYVPNAPIILHPGDQLHVHQGHSQDWVFGYAIWVEERVPVSAVEAAKEEFQAQVDTLKAEHQAEIAAVLQAIKDASVDSLREAALGVMTRAIADDLVAEIPERLADAIREAVENKFAEIGDPL